MSKERRAGGPAAGDLPGGSVPPQRAGAPDPGCAQPAPAAPGQALAAPRISGRCAWQVVEGEAVLLDLHGRRVVGLNPVGSFVFGLLDGARTVAALASSVAERFGVELSRAEADVRAFLAELEGRGFVEGTNP